MVHTTNIIDCKTVRFFAYSSTREQSNGLLRHALPISLPILRKKPTVLQSTNITTLHNHLLILFGLCQSLSHKGEPGFRDMLVSSVANF